MTVCRDNCGQCCDPVMLPYSLLEAMFDPRIAPEDRKWAGESLSPMPVGEALAKAPWLAGRRLADSAGGEVQPFYYRCANLDPETKACAVYDDRPFTCRGYPWYGGEPRPDAALPPDCSFQADLIQIGPKP